VTRDLELRHTGGGGAVCTLGVAVNRRYTTAQGEEREEVCFVDVEVWGRQAESCASYLSKGSPVFVEGRLRLDQWDDRDTGAKRSRLLVSAERVQFLSGPRRGSGAFGEESAAEVVDQTEAAPAPAPRPRVSEPPPMPPFQAGGDAVEDDIPF